jgi:serine/threonine-protein kinase
MSRDRDLLLAVTAVAHGLVGAEAILELGSEIDSRPDRSLGAILVERGHLSTDDLGRLEAYIAARLSSERDGPPGREEEGRPAVADFSLGFPASSILLGSSEGVTTAPATGDVPDAGPDPDSTVQAEASTLAAEAGAQATWPPVRDGLADPPPSRDRYRRGELLARGGMGEVWRIRDEHLGREVVLKLVRPDRRTGRLADRFLREAKVSSRLEHPNIVTLHELAGDGSRGLPFYTMRLVRGRTLADAIREYHASRRGGQAGRVELVGLLEGFITVCRAVAFAHRSGVLHRDLKPSNIGLGDFGEVIVLDWGLARVEGGAKDADGPWPALDDLREGHDSTLDGTVLGTFPYIPPEQARGEVDRVGPRSDVYSLGAILYELLTARRPYPGPTRRDYVRQVLSEPVAPPRRHEPSVPPALEAVCLKAMAREPEDRYDSAAALADDVRRWLADEPVSAYHDPLATRLRRAVAKHRTAAAAAAALVATAVVALAVGLVVVSHERDVAEVARIDAEHAEGQAQRSLLLAEANRDAAFGVTNQLLLTLAEMEMSRLPGIATVRLRLADRAAAIYREALARGEGDDPLALNAAEVFRLAGNLHRMTDDFQAAEGLYGEAIGLLRPLADRNGRSPRPRDGLAQTLRDLSQSLERSRGSKAARARLVEALEPARWLREAFPNSREYARTEGMILLDLGAVEMTDGLFEDAAGHLARGTSALADLADRPGPSRVATDPIAAALGFAYLADTERRRSRLPEAEAAIALATGRAEALAGAPEAPPDALAALGLARLVRARLLAADPARSAEALDDFDDAARRFEVLAAADPRITSHARRLAGILTERGRFLAQHDQPERALDDARAARERLEALSESSAGADIYLTPLGDCLELLGRLALNRGDLDEARVHLVGARERLDRALEHDGDNVDAKQVLERVRDGLGALEPRSP